MCDWCLLIHNGVNRPSGKIGDPGDSGESGECNSTLAGCVGGPSVDGDWGNGAAFLGGRVYVFEDNLLASAWRMKRPQVACLAYLPSRSASFDTACYLLVRVKSSHSMVDSSHPIPEDV